MLSNDFNIISSEAIEDSLLRNLAHFAFRSSKCCREAAIRAAQFKADVYALDQLIAEKLLFTGPDGQLGTKAQDLQLHSLGAKRFRSHTPEELRVRRVGNDVAITALRAQVEVFGTLSSSKAPTATHASGHERMEAHGE